MERGCAAVAEVAVFYPLYLAGMLYILGRPDAARFVDPAFLQQQLPVFAAVSIGALLLLGLGLWLRRSRPDSLLFQHITANYFGLSLVWAGYITGPLDFAAGVVLMGAAVTGYIVLDRRVILTAFAVAFFSLLMLTLFVAQGALPYAPAFVPPADVETRLFRLHAAFFLAAPHILFCLAATLIMLAQWRRSEARVLRMGITDGLTGLHNRRCILEILQREERRARQRGRPLAVALLDLDHFKRVNDSRGHLMGDRVLRQVAACLRAERGEGNEVGRFGGEEFLCVLPALTRDQALERLEHCRRRIDALDITEEEGESVPVSASFGLSWHAGGPELSADALMKAADEALYEAKRRGRNRVCTAPPREVPSGHAYRHRTIADLPAGSEEVSPQAREWLRRRITGAGDLSETTVSTLMTALISFQYIGYLAWGVYVLQRQDRAALVNAGFGQHLMPVMMAMIAGGLLLTLVGVLLIRRRVDLRPFTFLCHLYYGLTLVGLGYLVGLMSLPTGIVMLASPLLGLMFFRRDVVMAGFGTCMAALVVLAYAGVLGWIPYAPLVPEAKVHWRAADPFWVGSFYYFTLPFMIFTLVILDQVLGFWRRRGEYIQVLSVTDPLTRVHNRRNLMALLQREFDRARREQGTLSVVLLDIDHFKAVNDRRGHGVGDQVLRNVASALVEHVRDHDVVGRYGGEEFLMVLPGTDLPGAMALAGRCRERLQALEEIDEEGERFQVTGSFGVAALEAGDSHIEALLKRADDALYRAKESGRNRIETLQPRSA